MKTEKNKIAIAITALLLISSALAVFSNSTGTTVASADATYGDYGDLLQYEWTQIGGNGGWQEYSAGPAPNRMETLWTNSFTGFSVFATRITAFSGNVYVATKTEIYAFDAFTGTQKWVTQVQDNLPGFLSYLTAPTKIDDTYCFVDGDIGAGGQGIWTNENEVVNGTVTVLRNSDGAFVSNFTVVGVGFQPGTGGYFHGRYDPETHMKYVRGYDPTTHECSYFGIDLTDPVHPSLGWKTVLDESSEILCAGSGLSLLGTTDGEVIALNGTTGEVVWRAPKHGFAQYTATYVDGMFIHGSGSTTLTAYNATTGEIIWDKDQGGRAFFSHAGATGYGRFYAHNIAVPQGFVGCWDIKTGDLLWKQPALYHIGYLTSCVADGKLYIQRYSGAGGGVEAEVNTFACFDAFTGDLLWEAPNVNIDYPMVAYGNLYAVIGNTICCYSTASAKDWAMWRGNTDKSGYGTLGPLCIDTPKWAFETGGSVTGSAAAAEGKVYFGSTDKNIYCIDAYSGTLVWKFPTAYKIFSSPAVIDGKVFTGADDGSIYAIDANTGEQLWKTSAGGKTDFVFGATWRVRSSPIVVGNSLYVGALDGKVYCLNTANGEKRWTYDTGDAIGGSAAYSNGVIYIPSTDHYLYALDANNGNLVWKTQSNATTIRSFNSRYPFATPIVAEGVVYWGAGPGYGTLSIYALNQTTGGQIWVRNLPGATPVCQTPVFVRWNQTFAALLIAEYSSASLLDASNGATVWSQFLGHEVYSSIAYNPGVRISNSPYYNGSGYANPTFYIGCDVYSVTAFNATAAFNNAADTVLSVYAPKGEVQASPTIYDGNLYVPSLDGSVYMFNDVPTCTNTIYAEASKADQMWSNETLTIAGKLNPTVGSDYGSFAANGLPNATVNLSLTTPSGEDVPLTTTTDNNGYFSFSYSPTEVGDWGWVVFYDGEEKPWITYASAYSNWNAFNVAAPPTASETEPPPPAGLPMEAVYAAIAVIVIVVVVIGAYVFLKRRK